MKSLFRGGITYDVFKFNVSNVYFHVSQLDDFLSSSVFKIFLIVLDLQNALNVTVATSPPSTFSHMLEKSLRCNYDESKICTEGRKEAVLTVIQNFEF